MDVAGGYPHWVMWVVMFVGTAAFWVAVFLAVRALYVDRTTSPAPDPDPDPFREADLLGERLARGELTIQEYEKLRARSQAGPSRPFSRPPHY